MTNRTLLRKVQTALAAVSEDGVTDARLLAEKFLGLSFAAILTHGNEEAAPEKEAALLRAAERRAAGEPVQYLLGEWEFFGLPLSVGPGVLIPREDTCVLVEAVLERLPEGRRAKGLDLCSGTGAVAFALASRGCEMTAVEKFDAAFRYLTENQKRHAALGVAALQGDMLDAVFADSLPDGWDVIAANPPYVATSEIASLQREVRFEPQTAVDGGEDGLVFYRALCGIWAKKLRAGGVLAAETGETQGEAVAALFERAGLSGIEIKKDAACLDRAVVGTRRG